MQLQPARGSAQLIIGILLLGLLTGACGKSSSDTESDSPASSTLAPTSSTEPASTTTPTTEPASTTTSTTLPNDLPEPIESDDPDYPTRPTAPIESDDPDYPTRPTAPPVTYPSE